MFPSQKIIIEGKEYNPADYVGLILTSDVPSNIHAKIEMFFDAERPFFMLRDTANDQIFTDHADYIIFLVENSKT